MKAKRSRVLTCSLLGGLMVLLVWSYGRMSSSQADALAARENLEACRHAAIRISEVRARPSQVIEQAPSAARLARRIEVAAEVAALSANQIVRIDPQASRPLGDTAYEEQPTSLQLQLVSLKQLGTFLSAITAGESALVISSLRLSATPSEISLPTGEEAWQAEATLSYLVMSRKNAQGNTRHVQD